LCFIFDEAKIRIRGGLSRYKEDHSPPRKECLFSVARYFSETFIMQNIQQTFIGSFPREVCRKTLGSGSSSSRKKEE